MRVKTFEQWLVDNPEFVCPDCHGEGAINCPECEGDGACPCCGSKGKCQECDGEGFLDCDCEGVAKTIYKKQLEKETEQYQRFMNLSKKEERILS